MAYVDYRNPNPRPQDRTRLVEPPLVLAPPQGKYFATANDAVGRKWGNQESPYAATALLSYKGSA